MREPHVMNASWQDLAEAHMQAVSVEAILAGRAEGHKLRWADEFLSKHANSSDNCILPISG